MVQVPQSAVRVPLAQVQAVQRRLIRGVRALLEYPEMDIPQDMAKSFIADAEKAFQNPALHQRIVAAYDAIRAEVQALPANPNPTEADRQAILQLLQKFFFSIGRDVAGASVGVIGFSWGFVEDQIRSNKARWAALPRVYARLRMEILSQ
jgi:hypothetical protein